MVEPQKPDINTLRKRFMIAKGCVNNAVHALEEAGSDIDSEALVYSFSELSELLEEVFPTIKD
ncbi:MAG: hypothetical protein ABJ387_01495 [Balneola sp.]